jgi:hypothetical protein
MSASPEEKPEEENKVFEVVEQMPSSRVVTVL